MKQTDGYIRHRIADLMRLAGVLLLSAFTMLAVVSCGSGSGDEPGSPGTTPGGTTPTPGRPDEPYAGTPILFSAYQQAEEEEITRADTPLKDLVTSFKVWGFKNLDYNAGSGAYGNPQVVFPGYAVNWTENSANTTTSNTFGWEYVNQQSVGAEEQTIKYWDWDVKAYRFFGLSYDGTSPSYVDPYRFTFTVDAKNDVAAPYYSRLWFSTGNPETYPNRQFGKPVQLEFVKPLAKIRFLFISGDPNVALSQFHLENPDFKPVSGGIAVKGSFTVSYPLTGTDLRESWTTVPREYISSFTHQYTDADPYWEYVLPATGQVNYQLLVYVNGDLKATFVPSLFMDWQPGCQYTYVFKVSEEAGVEFGMVMSAYTNWLEGNEADRTIYNW